MKNSLILILLFCLNSCIEVSKNEYQPNRLKNIPKNAFWIGGSDGGNWYVIESINSHKNTASISLYNDQTGELILSKKFILVCIENKQKFIKNLENQINSFDGEKIDLNNGCWLQ